MESNVAQSEGVESVLEALRYENEKLKKTNQVLIERVEQGWANYGDAYRSFQNAALLADKVKDRTIKLRKTLYKLEEANQSLSETRLESAHSQQRLLDTIESISDAIVLFDKNRRLVLANSHFYEFWRHTNAKIEVGVTTFKELTPMALEHGIYDPEGKPFEKLVQRGDIFRDTVIRLADGRWLQVSERPTADDGLVVAYSDITQVKESEIARQEKVLAEQNRILQSLIANLPLGVVLVNGERSIEAWNDRFTNLVSIEPANVSRGTDFDLLLADSPLKGFKYSLDANINRGQRALFEAEQLLDDGRVIAIKSHLIPGGGNVNTYQDVTEQRRTAEALKNAYKHMEQRVHERTVELSALNHQLRIEIDERALVEQSLLEAKREAEDANISKTKFMTAASHDLLQPLNAARLFATALMDYDLPDSVVKLVNSLSYSLSDVESLLGTLVDISKLEAGIVEPILDYFPVNELMRNLANEFEKQAARADLEFSFVPCNISVYSDSQLLARILRNFLSNAIRYTDKGRILLGCRRRVDCLEIQVWDTGVGVPSDQLEEIFLEFKRVNAKKQREDKGLGLGLAIVDKLSTVLNHEIKLQSTLGKGSVFSVCVPYAGESEYIFVEEDVRPESQRDPLTGKRILVVDNDWAICEGMSLVLENWGCQVVCAQSLDDLCNKPELLNPRPDALVLDYHLDDDTTGLEAEVIIRERLSTSLPTVMITANYSNELRQQVKELGFHLLNKPIKPLKLKSVLVYLLSEK
ncbi:NahK/ErcS family hybrid sensor histidine kinase/response regulator [uncultured Zhongshania sp.]|jgi:signal transduction histidine kinase|uniref:hybrid sensor histidine kinase/response regulator n=1 Tax=uncultured Zhongshania sp. TaxID=1642288 RepID=UPI0025FE5AC6|nr:NahK/ErcS family hybrid sensor histidine kinase/response regulator [uncultured Zhongshania sp.]